MLLFVWRSVEEMQTSLDRAMWRELGIRLAQWRVLREIVRDRTYVTAKIVAERLGCSHVSVGPIVHRLVRDGRITRKHPNFARVGYALRETAAGDEVCRAGEHLVLTLAERWLDGLSDVRQSVVRGMLREWAMTVRDSRDPPPVDSSRQRARSATLGYWMIR